MPQTKNPLKQRLDDEKFSKAILYVRQSARSIKQLNSSELSHLNQILTGFEETWRMDAAQVQIPSGDIQHFNVISNPLSRAREIIGDSLQLVGNAQLESAALYLYVHLVREHLFKEANRRTAVLAVLWIVEMTGSTIDPQGLLEIKVGNLRNQNEEQDLRSKVVQLLK